jgi:hypothetical protein
MGLAGVSGLTGEYRFLDLPDRAGAGIAIPSAAARPALSPGGRYVAYWLKGRPSGDPWTHDEDVIVGVAVYDTVTGAIARRPIVTEHGLGPWALMWLDNERVFVWAGQHRGPAGSDATTYGLADGDWGTVWTIATGGTQAVDGTGLDRYSIDSVTGDGWIVYSRSEDDVVRVADPSTRPLQIRDVPVPPDSGAVVLSPSRENGVVLGCPPEGCGTITGGKPGGPVEVFTVGATRDPQLRTVPGLMTMQGETTILSMPDDDQVVLSQPSGDGAVLVRVDVETGDQQVLTRYQNGGVTYALDALGRDPVNRPAPPRPWDPRLTWGLMAVAAVVGVVAVVRWRRRVRP